MASPVNSIRPAPVPQNSGKYVSKNLAILLLLALFACKQETGSKIQPPDPCPIESPGPAASQALARVGAYYFDGWSGPLTNFHFNGMVNGPYSGRQPVTGWQDNTTCSVEQQIGWARRFGINFFVFLWYCRPDEEGADTNSAFRITRSLQNLHGLQYAINYVNGGLFNVAPNNWLTVVDEWVGYFKDSGYFRVNGKPLWMVNSMDEMRRIFGTSSAVAAAIEELRQESRAAGLPGVYVVGNFSVASGSIGNNSQFPNLGLAQIEGYDAISMYNYPYAPLSVEGNRSFSILSEAGKWIWNQAAEKSPLPFIPVAMSGWDPRPWDVKDPVTSALSWYNRNPNDVAIFIGDSITWAEMNPRLRSEESPKPPIVLIEAWNELGEGSYLVPTIEDGQAYGDALSGVLATPSARTRSVLSVDESGPVSSARKAWGTLTSADNQLISGASIELTATPQDGPGVLGMYQVLGNVPPGSSKAVAGFRVNTESSGPATSDFSVYKISFIQADDGLERVENADFRSGTSRWLAQGKAKFVSNDRGPGWKVQVNAQADESARLDSQQYAVNSGASFIFTISAQVAPQSLNSGYFMVAFLGDQGELRRDIIPLSPLPIKLLSILTDAAGHFESDMSYLGIWRFKLEAFFPGNVQYWPSYSQINREN